MRVLIYIFISLLLLSQTVNALIVYNQTNSDASVKYDGSATNAELSVVNVNGCSAVYLGNGWFITAKHVTTNIGSKVYQNGLSTTIDIINNELNAFNSWNADLKLFHVEDVDKLSSLQSVKISLDAINNLQNTGWAKKEIIPGLLYGDYQLVYGSELTLVGAGLGRDESSSLTDAFVNNGSSTRNVVRSGTAPLVNNQQTLVNSSTNEAIEYPFLHTIAELKDGRTNALAGDSGGGMFFEYEGEWCLVAVITNVAPDATKTSVTFASLDYGNDLSTTSRTFGIRLDSFAEKINEIITTPIPEASETTLAIALFALIFIFLRNYKR